ncbi:MAG TPA: hypothetical protein VHE61_18830 [Opitutaceae bacterium]|nr:hypothetical protein [Opitutaceae bacterium]
MKSARFLLIGIGALALLLAGTFALLLSPGFQTWLVRRELAARPDWHVTIGRVAAGFGDVVMSDVRLERDGVRVMIPSLDAKLSVPNALLRHRVDLSRFEAHGWTVELPSGGGPARSATGVAKNGTRATAFRDILAKLNLPVDVSIAAVDATGGLVLPDGRGTATVALSGGGVAAGQEGKLLLVAKASLNDRAVKAIELHGVLTATMIDPRRFSRFGLTLNATAFGVAQPGPVRLDVTADLDRTAAGEHCSLVVAGGQRQLLRLEAGFPDAKGPWRGSWQVDMRDGDFTPFMLGRALPKFAAQGEGNLDADASLAAIHAVGRLKGSIAGLEVLRPALSAIGQVNASADFDLAQRGSILAVTKLEVAIAADHPIGTIHTVQPFAFDVVTRKLSAQDADRDLLDANLQAVPLAWLGPFLGAYSAKGTDVTGELVALPRADGIRVRSKAPLVVHGLSVARSGRLVARNLDVSVNGSWDYTPQAWQAELSGVTVTRRDRPVMLLDAKAGCLAGPNQAIKATGLVSADVPMLLAALRGEDHGALIRGEATIEFAGSIAAEKQVQARVTVKNLAVEPRIGAGAVPALSADLRADIAPGGEVTLNTPVVLDVAGRKTDLTVAGTITPGPRAIHAQVTSGNLVIDDLKSLLPVVEALRGPPPTTLVGNAPTPPWPNWTGTLNLQLRRVLYSNMLEMNNVVGTLRLSPGEFKLEGVRAGVGETGSAKASGALTFNSAATPAYAAGADVALSDFDLAPFFHASNPKQPPIVDGKFVITTHLTGDGPAPNALRLTGTSDLTSKGGVFRGMPANVGNLVENSGKLASWLASAGNAITSLTGRKDYDEITSRSQAANELAKLLAAIPYDQLSLVLATDAGHNAAIRQFTLISPDIRLSGSGRITHVPGGSVADDSVTLEYQVRARGRPADLMKYLGVLDPKVDELGYAGCTIPVRVSGTLAQLDGTELSNRLVALAVEKTGLTEKAVDWINRLRGKTAN